MKPIFRTPKSNPAIGQENRKNVGEKTHDAVNVFCRIRPMEIEGHPTSVRVKSSTTIRVNPQDHLKQRNVTHREVQYKFKHIFESGATQREVFGTVAEPLVENLIRGRDSLLFTYGVTGSGKTFTMTGDLKEHGILPQCLDALFRTISKYQAAKFVFKPDRLNGFDILSEEDAHKERQQEVTTGRKNYYPEKYFQASSEPAALPGIDENNLYSVFVTYVEIYNNSVHDLLEGPVAGMKTMRSKIIRVDSRHRMFVHGVIEVEVKTVQEALEVFQLGQKRKHMGHTVLNAESSRSHSVFNIRLVQAPKNNFGGSDIYPEMQCITISQLSLVDLAGSERTSRTKTSGVRLREAGNINNSLMTLRTCLEYLRENQQLSNGSEAPKKVPYRDAKVTHLFKSYFDGEGQVSMIVCINPRMEDYDENIQVLKFGELTQEVQLARATPIKINSRLTPGDQTGYKLFKNDLDNPRPISSNHQLDSGRSGLQINKIISSLEQHLKTRKVLYESLPAKFDNLRRIFIEMDQNNVKKCMEQTPLKPKFCALQENKENSLNSQRSQSSDNILRPKTRGGIYVPAAKIDIYATPHHGEAALSRRHRQGTGIPLSVASVSNSNPIRTRNYESKSTETKDPTGQAATECPTCGRNGEN